MVNKYNWSLYKQVRNLCACKYVGMKTYMHMHMHVAYVMKRRGHNISFQFYKHKTPYITAS